LQHDSHVNLNSVSVINAPPLSSLAPVEELLSSKIIPTHRRRPRSDHPIAGVYTCVTRTIAHRRYAAAMCARHQPNEGRKVHSYCINSSLSFLSRAHLNQQKAPAAGASWCPLVWALKHIPLFSPSPFDRHSSTELNPPLASPKKPSSCFRATLEPAQSGREEGHAANSPKCVPFVPYGGLATNDSCYSFATQFSLRSTVSLIRSPLFSCVHVS